MNIETLAKFKEIENDFYKLETDDKIFKYIENNKDVYNVCLEVFDAVKRIVGDNQFKMVYQPHICNGKIIGAEALFRIRLDGENISPMSVFRLAAYFAKKEKFGYEQQFTLKVLKRVCRDIVDFKETIDQNFVVSVNVNPAILKGEFVDKLIAKAKYFGVINNLAIELLEVESVDKISREDFDKVKQSGIFICLDDFGSGYTDEAALSFPFNVVKFYGGLISGIHENPYNFKIVKDIANRCKEKGAITIAEHVEKKEELDACLEAGVQTFQGYLFSKPISKKRIIEEYGNKQDVKKD